MFMFVYFNSSEQLEVGGLLLLSGGNQLREVKILAPGHLLGR